MKLVLLDRNGGGNKKQFTESADVAERPHNPATDCGRLDFKADRRFNSDRVACNMGDCGSSVAILNFKGIVGQARTERKAPLHQMVPARAIVASRNGAAGYQLMRSSHGSWTSSLDPLNAHELNEQEKRQCAS